MLGRVILSFSSGCLFTNCSTSSFQTANQLSRSALAARLTVQQPGLAPLQGEHHSARLVVLHPVLADGDGRLPRSAQQPRGLLHRLALQPSPGTSYLLGPGLTPHPVQLTGPQSHDGDALLPPHLPAQPPGHPPRHQVVYQHLAALTHLALQLALKLVLQSALAAIKLIKLAATSAITSLPCTRPDLLSPVPAPCRYSLEPASRPLTLGLQIVLPISPRCLAPRSSVSPASQPALPGCQNYQVLLGLHLLVVDLVLAGLVPSVLLLLAPVSILTCCPTHPLHSGRQTHALGDLI